MPVGRATALLLWLVASQILLLFLAERSARLDATEAALDRARGAGLAVEQVLDQEGRALRSVAGLIASDPGLDDMAPRDALEARWPHLTVDLLALERGDEVSTVAVVDGVELEAGAGAGPRVERRGGAVWLLVGEGRPASSDRIWVGRRIDGDFLDALAGRLGVELVVTVDGALAAESVRAVEGGGSLLAAADTLDASGATLSVARVEGALGTGWVVASPVVEAGRGGALRLTLLASALIGTVLFLALPEPRAPRPAPTATLPPAPNRDAIVSRQALELADQRRKVELYQRFLARLALELRTSVTGVIGYAELLKEEAQRDERWSAASDVDRILVGARTGLDLVEDTLALTAIETGEVQPSLDIFQLGTVIHDVVGALRPIGAGLGTRIELESGHMGSVVTDRSRLRHVLRNLVARALHAAPGGHVRVAARREGSVEEPWIRVDVHDDGPSLTPAQLDGLFAVSASDASDLAGPGSTIGLVVARRFASLLGGDVGAVTSPGGGTCITLRIPARLAPHAVDEALGATGPGSSEVER